MEPVDVETPRGVARVNLEPAATPRGVLVLGHGAGGGIGAPDLVAAAAAARAEGLTAALVEQPYRVAGRRSSPPTTHLDEAWLAVVEHVRATAAGELPLVVGGRSAGARVACRTAGAAGAAGVLCLAFPLRPPGRPDAPSRLHELEQVDVSLLVVQGERDPDGIPPTAPRREIALVPGTHTLRSAVPVTSAVREWLARLL